MERAVADDGVGTDVGLFLRRRHASRDPRRRGHGLYGPGD